MGNPASKCSTDPQSSRERIGTEAPLGNLSRPETRFAGPLVQRRVGPSIYTACCPKALPFAGHDTPTLYSSDTPLTLPGPSSVLRVFRNSPTKIKPAIVICSLKATPKIQDVLTCRAQFFVPEICCHDGFLTSRGKSRKDSSRAPAGRPFKLQCVGAFGLLDIPNFVLI